jgi:hypothetical protein
MNVLKLYYFVSHRANRLYAGATHSHGCPAVQSRVAALPDSVVPGKPDRLRYNINILIKEGSKDMFLKK